MKQRVALVQPPAWGVKCPPYGISVLKSYLQERGYEVTALDLNLRLYRAAGPGLKEQWEPDRHQFWLDAGLVREALGGPLRQEVDRWLAELLALRPRVVGFSTLYSNEAAGLALAERVKEADPSCVVVFGGPQAGRDAGGYALARRPCVDFVVDGEGEETFHELLSRLEQGRDAASCPGLILRGAGGEARFTGLRPQIRDLGSLPFADYSDYPLGSYTERGCVPVSLSRGCPNRCAFCYELEFWRTFRSRPAESLVAEVKHQRRVLPSVEWLWFHDSLVNGHRRHLEGFASGLVAEGIPTRWAGQAVIRKDMSRELLGRLARSGCMSLNYGLESASFSVMLKMGKLLARGADADAIVRDTSRAGIDCILNFMFGFPGETEEDFQATLDFVRRNKDHIAMVQPSPGFCDFYPGTRGHREPETLGIELREGSAHWVSKDGTNTYLTRMARFERFLDVAHGLGVKCSYPHRSLYQKNTIVGSYHFVRGEHAQAVPYLRAALESDPPNETTRRTLDDALARLRVRDEQAARGGAAPLRDPRHSPSRYWALLWELTRTEFKLRDQGTALGFLWTLLHPALMFLVLYVLFTKWLGRHVEDYAAYLLVGLVQWQFFEKATAAGLSSLRRKAALIRNFDFAREIVVAASAGSVFVSYVMELAVMLAFLALLGVAPTAGWLALPLLVLVTAGLVLSVSLALALLSAEFEDLERVWGLLLAAGFYVTPVFYPLHLVSADYHGLMSLNPLLHVLDAWRACLLSGGLADWTPLAAVGAAGAALAAGCLLAFRRWERRIAGRVISS